MPFIIDSRRTGRTLLATLGGVLAFASTAAAEIPSASTTCTTPTLAQKFLNWNDSSWYTTLPGGDVETGLKGWDLAGGAVSASGNEPWFIGSSADKHSLYLPSGATATSKAMCVAVGYPYLRLFVRNTGASSAQLGLDILYLDSAGGLQTKQLMTQSASSTAWSVTSKISIASGLVASKSGGQAPIALRFRALGTGGKWSVDDVYVDPYKRG